MPFDVTYTVDPIAQSKSMSCWAAAAAMLLSWKSGLPNTELAGAQAAGEYYVNAFNSDVGLLGSEVEDFANRLSLNVEQPQNYTPDGYNQLLMRHGPLWAGAVIHNSTEVYRHVRILRGLQGDGTFDGTAALVVDPDGGRDYTESLTAFARELEEIARQDGGSGNKLYPQAIHFP